MEREEWLRRYGRLIETPYERQFFDKVLGRLAAFDFTYLRAQRTIEVSGAKKLRRVDFTIEEPNGLRLAIEVNGYYKRGPGSGPSFDDHVDDHVRANQIEDAGFDLIRFANSQVRHAPDACLRTLESKLERLRRLHDAASRQPVADPTEIERAGETRHGEPTARRGSPIGRPPHAARRWGSTSRTSVRPERRKPARKRGRESLLSGALGFAVLFGVWSYAANVARESSSGTSCRNPIPSAEAGAHVHEEGAVEGEVLRAVYRPDVNGRPTFINLGNRMTELAIVIWGSDRDRWTQRPERAFANGRVCVQGTITEYRGQPQVVVREPRQLRLAA